MAPYDHLHHHFCLSFGEVEERLTEREMPVASSIHSSIWFRKSPLGFLTEPRNGL